MNKAEEYLPKWIKKRFGIDYSLTTYNDESMIEFAEAYHQSRVNAEIYRDIPNYKGLYQISNYGNIKSIGYGEEKLLKQSLSGIGYLAVSLVKHKIIQTRTTHQLVAETFLNHKPSETELVINHINLDKTDNRLGNIEIITQRKNSNLKHIKSSSKYVGVSWNKQRQKWKSTIVMDGKNTHLGYYKTELQASDIYQTTLELLKQ